MAAGYQVKGNIICYQLTKYFLSLTSRFSAIFLWLNSCQMGMCWHDCARIHPNIDNSRNAIYPICRGWMAAGYRMKGNIVFYPMTKYFFKYNEPFFRNASFNIDRLCHKTKSESRIWYFFSMFPGTPDAQTAAAKWLRGSKWKAILFAICWRNNFQF